jgi:hypothetical protein
MEWIIWTAVSNVPWITIASGGSGSGHGKVNYTVAANTSGGQRVGTITISGQPPPSGSSKRGVGEKTWNTRK